MKKVLLATSALVASAGIASADITLTGGADFGMKDSGVNGTDAYIHAETDFNIVATATTDNGYTIGASIDLDDDLSAAGSVSDTEISLSGDFGTLSFGELAAAQDGHGLADVGFDSLGVDDDVEARRTTSSADLKYATTFGDMSVTVTYALGTSAAGAATDGDYGILLGFDNAGFGVTVGMDVDDDGGANDTSTSLGLTYTVGEINLAGFFADDARTLRLVSLLPMQWTRTPQSLVYTAQPMCLVTSLTTVLVSRQTSAVAYRSPVPLVVLTATLLPISVST